MTGSAKLLVISLDGATFDVLRSWAEQGLLPNIASIVGSGVSGKLRSTIPPVTAPAWASFQTGKNPGKHGLFDFTRYQPGCYSTSLVNATSLEGKTIWEILGGHGKRVAVVNVPLTYPPARVNGFMISGMLTPQTAKGFYPPELYDEVVSAIGDYQIFTPAATFDFLGVKRFVDRLAHLATKRMEAALLLLDKEQWDFFMVHFQESDVLQHALWAFIDPAHPDFEQKAEEERSYVVGFYRALDEMIGKLQQRAGEERALVILSDHGFGPLTKRIFINQWLMQEGFLAQKGSPLKRRLMGLAEAGLRKIDVLKVRRRFAQQFDRRQLLVRRVLQAAPLDWPHTKAFSPFGSVTAGIFLNCVDREPEGIVEWGTEREELLDDIAEGLMELKDSDTGQKVIEEVFKREEIYHGGMLASMPDLVVQPAEGYMVVTFFRGDILLEPAPEFMTGTHRMDGILLMEGHPFLRGAAVRGAEITDLAPTILYLAGVPIPTDMDGKVLTKSLKASYLSNHPIKHEHVESGTAHAAQEAYSSEHAEDIRKRLAGLGYLS